MTILDRQLVLSDEQALTTATAASTNVIDTGVADSNQGGSGHAWFVCEVSTAFTSGGAGTMKIALEDSATAGGTYATLLESEVLGSAALTAGTKLMQVSLPAEHKRALRVLYTVAGATMTAGKVNAYVTYDAPTV